MRAPNSFSRSRLNFFSLLLVYTLTISLFAPFAVRRVEASPVAKPEPQPAAAREKKGRRRDGELLVRFRQGVSEQDKTRLVEGRGGKRAKRLRGRSRLEKLTLKPGQDLDAVLAELRQNPAIEVAEPNYLVSRDEVVPNDASFPEQWALRNTGATGGQAGADIQAVPAWETTTGAPTTIIAVIDSGIDFTHSDLLNNQWTNSAESNDGNDNDNNGLADDLHGWDWVTDGGAVVDENGHGTMVAGIIAAEGNNGVGSTGVMWRAGLMSLRVLDNTGTGSVADAVEAIDYAVNHGAQVINCSWGTDEASVALRDAIERAGERGVVVVSSAGNSGRDIESVPYYPSFFGLSNQISVASTDNFDRLASWSNYGATHVTIAAPGVDILTTKMGGGYTTINGTSASTALVTGVAGLIKTRQWWLTAADTRAAIVNGARPVAELTGKVSSGSVASAGGALAAMPEPGPEPTPYPGGGSQTGGTNTDNLDSSLPNLDEARNLEPPAPVAPRPIQADACGECDHDPAPAPAAGTDPYFATARTWQRNETGKQGVTLGSRNFGWGLPLLSLPGRSGMDLNLGISYNSLVWTKQGTSIMFNADRGNPSPGFRLGLPTLEAKHVNQDSSTNSYLLILPSGGRVALKHVGGSGSAITYRSEDSSYVQAVDSTGTGTSLVVTTTDGTQYKFGAPIVNSVLSCTEIKDRNGNFITISYLADGRINNIKDTLTSSAAGTTERILTFEYNDDDQVSAIKQKWGGVLRAWATFGYATVNVSGTFTGLTSTRPDGPIRMLSFIGLGDGTSYKFDYTPWGQVWKLSHYAQDNHLLSYTRYNLPGAPNETTAAQLDCPRFTERHDWAQNWNGDDNGTPLDVEESVTVYEVDPNSAGGNQPAWSKVTTPDGTTYKELYATSGWQTGLTIGTEVSADPDPSNGTTAASVVKTTTVTWTQDNLTLPYQKNPRPSSTLIDDGTNERRTSFTYFAAGYATLLTDVTEYAADTATVLRRTHTDYVNTSAYTSKRLVNLPSAKIVYDKDGNVLSKVAYEYDEAGEFFVTTDAPSTQHDSTNYGSGFRVGRGNVTSVKRYDADADMDETKVVESNVGYNLAGSVVLTKDPLGHGTSISYADKFSDTAKNALNTRAFPTEVTDPEGFKATAEYNYDFGAVTKTTRPANGTEASITYSDVTYLYDTAGRLARVTSVANSAYTRWTYPTSNLLVNQYQTVNGSTEAYSAQVLDGAGRVTKASSDNPGSTGLYSGQKFVYDIMGRLAQQSNPVEMTGAWALAGKDAQNYGDWQYIYTTRTYDWKGRVWKTTSPDGTFTKTEYNVCGCAGSDQVTTTDERGRQKKLYKDVLGRLVKVQELNFGGALYAETTYTYDTLDHLTGINQAGKPRTFSYDGHGRLIFRKTQEQGEVWYTYNADDTVATFKDARGVVTTYSYDDRHLPTAVEYDLTNAAAYVAATPGVTFEYDAAGNRTKMTDGQGTATYHYDSLSRMDWEKRTFTDLGAGEYRLGYAYNRSGAVTAVVASGPAAFGASVSVNYTYDKVGRATAVTGSGFATVTNYISDINYRGWGAVDTIAYANGNTLTLGYDSRLRLTNWELPGVMRWGYKYKTTSLPEDTGRVVFADNLDDPTLDRSYQYDHVGRLAESHSGNEANGHAGITSPPTGTPNGPYSAAYGYDQFGNMTSRAGWGTEFESLGKTLPYTYNRLTKDPVTDAVMSYDASGNLAKNGPVTYTYDATGQQTSASTGLAQVYNGGGVRVKKTENNVTTYYLRSSVLGNQVIAELNSSGGMKRGYVYLGGQLVAVQEGDQAGGYVSWVHQDPVTKSQRMTNAQGGAVPDSITDLDPWGDETGRSSNPQPQPHTFTTYERDSNGGDEAMFRRYESKISRFSQPDHSDGSYDLTNPQSFNRYTYTQNDPVNFIDPSGLLPCMPGNYSAECGFGGWGGGYLGGNGWGDDPRPGLWDIFEAEEYLWPAGFSERGFFHSVFEGYSTWGGYQQEKAKFLDAQTFHDCVLTIYEVEAININTFIDGPYNFTGRMDVPLLSGKVTFTLEANLNNSGSQLGFWAGNIGYAPSLTYPYIGNIKMPQIYVASELISNHSQYVYAQSLFVYEIGNALHALTGKGEKPRDPDRYGPLRPGDVGGRLMDCVYGGRVNERGTVEKPKPGR